MKKYGEAAVLEMYCKALPEVVKNAATPLANVDKITMYGDGNSSRLVGDIIGSTTKVTDGLTAATGVDIRALLAGFLGGKAAAQPAEEKTETADNSGDYQEYTDYGTDYTDYTNYNPDPDTPEL